MKIGMVSKWYDPEGGVAPQRSTRGGAALAATALVLYLMSPAWLRAIRQEDSP